MAAKFMPSCPRCCTGSGIRQSNISSAGLFSHWVCIYCNTTFVEKFNKMQFMILRNPETTVNSAPKKFFDTEEQALTVAKKMAREYKDTFYVIKLIKKVSINEIPVIVEDL